MITNETKQFVHLHVHTIYSKLDGMAAPKELFEAAQALSMPAVAITDHGSVQGFPDFLRAAKEFPDIKPIFGCEFYLKRPDSTKLYHVLLLAKNLTGLKNLIRLDKLSQKNIIRNRPSITRQMLAECSEGLICTSACIGGELAQALIHFQYEQGLAIAWLYKAVFGDDYYVEIDLHENSVEHRIYPLQQRAAPLLYRVSRRIGAKVVAANDVHYMCSAEAEQHDRMLAANFGYSPDDPKRLRFTGEEWFKGAETMCAVFDKCPEAITSTLEIASKVENLASLSEYELNSIMS